MAMSFKWLERLKTLALIGLLAVIGCAGPADGADSNDDEIACDPTTADTEQCPAGTTCAYKHIEGRESTDEGICHESCDTDDDCPEQRPNCTPDVVWGSYACSQADYNPRNCDPQASADDCECGIGDNNAVVVEGSGDDCTIVEDGVTACFEQAMTCLNDCVDQMYRYELDDGQAIIVEGYQGAISDGWEPVDHTGECAALEEDNDG